MKSLLVSIIFLTFSFYALGVQTPPPDPSDITEEFSADDIKVVNYADAKKIIDTYAQRAEAQLNHHPTSGVSHLGSALIPLVIFFGNQGFIISRGGVASLSSMAIGMLMSIAGNAIGSSSLQFFNIPESLRKRLASYRSSEQAPPAKASRVPKRLRRILVSIAMVATSVEIYRNTHLMVLRAGSQIPTPLLPIFSALNFLTLTMAVNSIINGIEPFLQGVISQESLSRGVTLRAEDLIERISNPSGKLTASQFEAATNIFRESEALTPSQIKTALDSLMASEAFTATQITSTLNTLGESGLLTPSQVKVALNSLRETGTLTVSQFEAAANTPGEPGVLTPAQIEAALRAQSYLSGANFHNSVRQAPVDQKIVYGLAIAFSLVSMGFWSNNEFSSVIYELVAEGTVNISHAPYFIAALMIAHSPHLSLAFIPSAILFQIYGYCRNGVCRGIRALRSEQTPTLVAADSETTLAVPEPSNAQQASNSTKCKDRITYGTLAFLNFLCVVGAGWYTLNNINSAFCGYQGPGINTTDEMLIDTCLQCLSSENTSQTMSECLGQPYNDNNLTLYFFLSVFTYATSPIASFFSLQNSLWCFRAFGARAANSVCYGARGIGRAAMLARQKLILFLVCLGILTEQEEGDDSHTEELVMSGLRALTEAEAEDAVCIINESGDEPTIECLPISAIAISNSDHTTEPDVVLADQSPATSPVMDTPTVDSDHITEPETSSASLNLPHQLHIADETERLSQIFNSQELREAFEAFKNDHNSDFTGDPQEESAEPEEKHEPVIDAELEPTVSNHSHNITDTFPAEPAEFVIPPRDPSEHTPEEEVRNYLPLPQLPQLPPLDFGFSVSQ